MTDVPNVPNPVSQEAKKQAVILLFTLAGVVAVLATQEVMGDWKTVKMATALTVKRVCQKEADRWQRWADDAATAYNRERA